jgi:hypothetical protein
MRSDKIHIREVSTNKVSKEFREMVLQLTCALITRGVTEHYRVVDRAIELAKEIEAKA